MSDFEPVGAERYGQVDGRVEAVEVLPVHDRVDGQRQPRLTNEARRSPLCLLSSEEAGDAIAEDHVGILEAELDVLETGVDQFRQPAGVEMNAGGDQIAV